MNCTSACTYTLPSTQPEAGWTINLESIGSTPATIGLSGSTYNGSSTAPTLETYHSIKVFGNSGVTTDYEGDAPITHGSNVSITGLPNAFNVAATGGGGGNYVNLCSSVTIAGASCSGGVITFSASTAVTISAIPGTYINLKVSIRGYVSTGDPAIVFQVNGDTTQGDYECQRWFLDAATTVGQTCSEESIAGGNGYAGEFGASSADGNATEIDIPFYASSLPPTWIARTTFASLPYVGLSQGSNSVAGALTSITMTANGGGNMTGAMTLYGTN
jgi:hypothetical protein